MLTRRHAILLGAGAAVSTMRLDAAEFWEKKQPSEWTDKEKEKLLTHSPWAKQVSVEIRGAGPPRDRGPIGGPGMGGPGMGGPGMGPPGAGGPGAGGPGMGQGPLPGSDRGGVGGGPPVGVPDDTGGSRSARVLVRWESALPIREAAKNESSGPEKSNYLISVTGLPMMPPGAGEGGDMEHRREAMLETLKSSTSLQTKKKDAIKPESVQEAPGPQRALLFAFPRGSNPISPEDKEVTFLTSTGPMQIKAKFSLKDMTYRGNLEL